VTCPSDFDDSVQKLPTACRERLVAKMQSLFCNGLANLDRADHPLSLLDFTESLHAQWSPVDPSCELRLYFLKMWADMLRDYRNFCLYLNDSSEPVIVFDAPLFLQSKEGNPFRYEPFLRGLIQTSYFPTFLYQRISTKGLVPVSHTPTHTHTHIFTPYHTRIFTPYHARIFSLSR
jgi:hypothetical protein